MAGDPALAAAGKSQDISRRNADQSMRRKVGTVPELSKKGTPG